jgi:UDP-N-acetylmuramoyl-L-alanyl-D-glutamate--2,6-diaminopimelate ligase
MRPLLHQPKSFLDLTRFLGLSYLGPDLRLGGVVSNSQEVEPGDLFIGLPGAKTHGAQFHESALRSGAVAILTDQVGADLIASFQPVLIVSDIRRLTGEIAAWFYDFPFFAMRTVGITGTNGKTTTAALLHQLWQLEHREVGFIGTVGIEIGSEHFPTQFTTPESCALQSTVATMKERHITDLVMEVSSHAIDQYRIFGSHFNAVAFTNLTQDHLDYHGSIADYFAVKAKLFTPQYADVGIINADDPYGDQLLELATIPTIAISRSDAKRSWYFTDISEVKNGFQVALRGKDGVLIEGFLPLIGEYNLDNFLMATALAVESGIDPISIAANMSLLRGVSGRLQSVDLGQNFRALVDFAHTPDAVNRVLKTLRNSPAARIIAVLGCGGDRDRSKRPVMGKALLDLSDVAIFTSDNPRTESALDILNQMTAGFNVRKPNVIELDRRVAIRYAVAQAQPGDTIVILGKGHELGQEILGVKHPFDDRKELALAIEEIL